MEALPMVAPPCSLSDRELRDQLARYRAVGDAAELLERSPRRIAIRLDRSVREQFVERVLDVERDCCPFFELSWDRGSRCLTISVSAIDQEAALAAIAYALGLAKPDSGVVHGRTV